MRPIAGAFLAVAMTVTALAAQVTTPPARILSARSRSVIGFDAFMADVGGADVVFLNERSTASDLHRLEVAVVQALAGRPDVILALDAVDRSAQDPLEHFLMEHLSAEEFAAEAKMSASVTEAYLPLLKLAVVGRWPIVATGGPGKDAAAIAAPLIQALAIGSTGGKRPLLISIHAGPGVVDVERTAELVLAKSPGRRAVTVALAAVSSFEAVPAVAATPSTPNYLVYTLTSH